MIQKILSFLSRASDSYEIPAIENDEQHDALYQKGAKLVSPYLIYSSCGPRITDKARYKLHKGIAYLDAVTSYAPKNWAAFWVKGKAYQVLGNHEEAHASFAVSFSLERENPDVAREYAAACLELGMCKEALAGLEHAISLCSDDAGLYANLALAHLMNAEDAPALAAIEKSLDLAPKDIVSHEVQRLIRDVSEGRRERPTKMADCLVGV